MRTGVRTAPGSPYAAVCVAFDRGYLDDPASHVGLAHLYEHLWFLRAPADLTLEWGATHDHATVLHHVCPPDEVPVVLAALADRLADCCAPSPVAAHGIRSALRLIELERRGGQERRLSGFPRRQIARLLRADPQFEPTAVAPAGPELVELVDGFAHGVAVAVCVAGPEPGWSAGDLRRSLGGAVPGAGRPRPGPPVGGAWQFRAPEGNACAAAWILPPDPATAAAAWVLGGLIDRGRPPTGLHWLSGRVLSPRGTEPVRGGLLYALAAGLDPRRPLDLAPELLLPVLAAGADDLAAVRDTLPDSAPDPGELAALDALSLLHGSPRFEAVLAATRQVDHAALLRFVDLLAAATAAAGTDALVGR
ncbi:hypothetical protein C7C46_04840 [Streptomyces tateyamensis]|uniref:Uncharacterized protein n=1 Tax=Streptomyces tateyamensis TaxID=565073 RepID=A0A2V4NUJ4_9ACTN|nr:hypothetical protein C7C46_04840 [Streptomyces tateyamensis]